MSIENATVRERALLHLSRFPNMNPSELYNIPFDLTQDGIASVLGISRAHASLELKKLQEGGKADDWLAHIKGSNTKRKVYYLLPDGTVEAELLEKRFEKSGIAVEALLDMKRCDPEIMWDSLNKEDKETFGIACVHRVDILRKKLKNTTSGVIPADFSGNTSISEVVREKYLSHADPRMIKRWHSEAADLWLDENERPDRFQERLYHLMKAGRHLEACKHIIRNEERFLENPNEDLLALIKGLTVKPDRRESILRIRAQVALECEDLSDALACADKLADYLTNDADLIRAEAYMRSGDVEKGFALATSLFEKSPSSKTARIAAKCLLKMKKYNEASELMESSGKVLSDNNDTTGIVDMMLLKANIAYCRGKTDESLGFLSKAKKTSKNKMVLERIDIFSKNIRNGKSVNFD